jgi:hypothetical protein
MGTVLLLDEVVAAHQAALALHPEGHVHPGRHYSRSHLGTASLSRYNELTEDDDLHQAIALQNQPWRRFPMVSIISKLSTSAIWIGHERRAPTCEVRITLLAVEVHEHRSVKSILTKKAFSIR